MISSRTAQAQASATGYWNWQATCPEGAFYGDFGIGDLAADGSFSGGFANGNGSLQGRVQGAQVIFVRTLSTLQQRWIATVTATKMEQGTIERPTEQKSACSFVAAFSGPSLRMSFFSRCGGASRGQIGRAHV